MFYESHVEQFNAAKLKENKQTEKQKCMNEFSRAVKNKESIKMKWLIEVNPISFFIVS